LDIETRGAPAARAPAYADRPRRPPSLANRPGLTLDVGEQAGVIVALQRLLDQRAEDDLQAHRQLVGRRRPARQRPRPVENILRQHEKNPRTQLTQSRSLLQFI
jgi:hypothetical protein